MQTEKRAIRNTASDAPYAAETLVELLQRRAAARTDRQAYVFLTDGETDGVGLTYGELDQKAKSIAAVLQALNTTGARVLLLFPPGTDYIAAFFACLYAGVIAVPAYPPRNNEHLQRLEAIATDAQATIGLTLTQSLSRLTPVLAESSVLSSLRWITTEEISLDLADQWRQPFLDADSLAFLQYTSGSTSMPKGVMVSHRNLLHNQPMIQRAFRQSEQSVIVSWLPLYHDMGLIGGMLQPLFVGAKCILMSPTAFLQRPFRWLEAISSYKATTSGGPNFAFDICVDKTTPEQRGTLDLSSWSVAFNGSEPVRAETLERFATAFEPCGFRREAFHPCYGLAEATLFVSGGQIDKAPTVKSVSARGLTGNLVIEASSAVESQTLVGSGALPDEIKVIIVDPKKLTPCRYAQVGEIWISGASVTNGYWGAPEETSRTFQGFISDTKEGPFLRTGDLGFVENGELFVTGRLKDLIIVRGVNYYPQDIERTVEQSHKSLRRSCGAAFSIDVDGQERLVIVQEMDARSKADRNQVVDAIRQSVAVAHELQAYAVALLKSNSIPKTTSGKIQRHKCRARFLNGELKIIAEYRGSSGPEVRQESADLKISARTAQDIEAFLISRVAAKLRVDPSTISASDSIAQYGLDSLMALELTHEVETSIGIILPVSAFLERPTIAEVAAQGMALLAGSSSGVASGLALSSEDGESYPVSYGQQALWFLQQFDELSAAYNIVSALRVVSGIDVEALRRALQALVDRHSILRATFTRVQGKPVQRIQRGSRISFKQDDASNWSERYLSDRLTEFANLPFSLEEGPLFRVYLFTRSEREHVLLLVLHHLIADFWSLEVLLNELSLLYSAETRSEFLQLPPLPAQYGDYVRWQTDLLAGPEGERLWKFWQERLAGDLPPLDLPVDKPRPSIQTFHGDSESLALNQETTRELKTLAQSGGTTLYAVLLAAFHLFLHRYTSQNEIVIGSPTSGRNRAELAELVGYFVNPIPIRVDFSEIYTFSDLLALMRTTLLAAYQHQEYPFALMVERLQPVRHPGRSPLFQVMFVFHKAHLRDHQELAALALGEKGVQVRLGDIELETLPLAQRTVQFDLTLMAAEASEGIALSMQYNTDLFDRATITRAVDNYKTLLESIIREPDRPILDLPIVSENEKTEVLEKWNRTEREYARGACLHELFEEQAGLWPEAVAIVCGDEQVTYGELNERGNKLAHFLISKGIGPEQIVPICVERSIEMVVGLVGILKTGGAYVPLDPSYPRQRLAYMVEDAGARVLVTQEKFAREFSGMADEIVSLDRQREEIAGYGSEEVEGGAGAGNLAYVIYTSGSTGRPKGVAIEHTSAVAMVSWARQEYSEEELSGVLASTSICFDLSVFELFAPLSWGGRVILVENALALIEMPRGEEVKLINTVPSAIGELARAGAISESVKTVNLAGEALRNSLAQDVYRTSSVERVMNLYGPSEDTTYSTYCEVERGGSGAPAIGKPISNGQAYVLDNRMNPVPLGVVGELYVAGVGLARCYWKRAELTAERFVPNPYSAEAGRRMYRTGDLCRYKLDGELEYIGRIDHQVKVRGYRIELGEIEEALRGLEGVNEAVVVVKEDGEGDKRLVGYVVGENALGDRELRDVIRERLPEYMVPAVIMKLEEMPLTPNGKVNRGALPEPEYETDEEVEEEARGEIEEIVAGVFGEVLRKQRVGRGGDFFEMGGHSLLAAQVVSRLAEVFRIELPLRTVFEAPTVAQMSAHIQADLRRAAPVSGKRIEPRKDGQPPVLSHAQQRLWFLDCLEPNTSVYNMPAAFRLEGKVHAAALERSFTEIVRRHEVLRMRIETLEGQPVPIIEQDGGLDLQVIDLSGLEGLSRESEANRLVCEEARRPFDLSKGRLLRLRLLRLGPEEHVLMLNLHHIVADGWSMKVLADEVSLIYKSFVNGEECPLEALRIQQADFALWQREYLQNGIIETQLSYWKDRLSGLPPVLEIPTNHPRPAIQTFSGANYLVMIDAELLNELKALSRRESATLFMTLLGAFKALLYRYTGQREIAVGSPFAGRNRVESEGLIGLFANTLVLRTDLSGEMSFRELIRLVRETVLEASANQDVPFEKLVEELQPERNLSHAPLFQVMFVMAEEIEGLELTGLRVRQEEVDSGTARFDLTVWMKQAGDQMEARIEYNIDLFVEETIRTLADHFQNILRGIVRNPDKQIGELEILGENEKTEVLEKWNRTEREYARGACLHELFEEQAGLWPEAVAIVCGDEQVTYGELNERGNKLAHFLISKGIGPEQIVPICVERSIEMVVGLVGILKTGGAYVPLDPSYPRQRLAYMVEDAGARVLVTQEKFAREFSGMADEIVSLDRQREEIAGYGSEEVEGGAGAGNLAYVIYTSGSTGRPKGVAIEHTSAVAMVSWARQEYSEEELSGVLASTSICFDLSVFELFAPLSWGGRVILVENALALIEMPRGEEVKLINTVPSAIGELARAGAISESVKTVNLAGEALRNSLAQDVYRTSSVERVMNLYGPSEDTTYSTYCEVERGGSGAPAIGKPISNGQAYVLDNRMNPVPLGVVGELYVAGVGLARCYWKRAELTAERFVPNPYSAEAGRRMYRTGDLCRYKLDGELEYIGRIDHQVKVRGYRIELGEIEEALRGLEGVNEAVVVVKEDGEGDKRLVGYVVGENALGDRELRDVIRERLPEYMVPAVIMKLEEMPLTPNGKVNRGALPEPEYETDEEVEEEARGEIEEIVAGVFGEVLRKQRVGRGGDFFEMGGHSLLAAQVVSRLAEVFRIELPLRTVFEAPTVAQMSESIGQKLLEGERQEDEGIARINREGDLELSYGQQQLWILEQMGVAAGTYNISVAVRLRGELHVESLEESFNEVINRHEVMRTRFTDVQGQPMQRVEPELKIKLVIEDLSRLDEVERMDRIKETARQESSQGFLLSKGELLHVRLLRAGELEHTLILTMHHIISDGWSIGVLMRELSELYTAKLEQREANLENLEIQYADYAAWQRRRLNGDKLSRQLEYWRKQLGGNLSLLDFPTDRPRPAVQTYNGASEHLLIGNELRNDLEKLGRKQSATLYMILMAAYKVLLQKHTGQQDIMVGTPLAGRTNKQTESLIGFFVNMLVMRTDVSDADTFLVLLKKEREVALDAYANQEVPFERLVEELHPRKDLSRSPIFQVSFNMLNFPEIRSELPGLIVETFLPLEAESKFDMTLYASDKGHGIQLDLVYNSDLFDRSMMVEILEQFHCLLDQITTHPDRTIAELSLITPNASKLLPDPKQPILPRWEGAAHEAFSRQACRLPDKIAIIHRQTAWTYKELDDLSNRLAYCLRRSGIERGDIVAVYADRSASLVLAILGILKAGAAFAVLDSAYSASRLMSYFDACQPRGWIQIEEAGLPPSDLQNLIAESPLRCRIELSDPAGEGGPLTDCPPEALGIPVDANALAYVAFTSGSTGEPKVIAGTHGPLSHFLKWHTDTFGLNESDRCSMLSGISHDPALRDIFTPLWLGATLCIPSPEAMQLPQMLLAWLRRDKISVAHITPAMVQLLGETLPENSGDAVISGNTASLRYVFLGGDVATRRDVVALRHLAPSVKCVNFYGATETPQAMGYFEVNISHEGEADASAGSKKAIPIGRGIDGVQLLVLTRNSQLAGIGEIGEICVRTPYLTKGYLNDEELTRDRYIMNPFGNERADRVYRTGDLGRYLPDGDLEFCGRADRRLKIRGFRIELGEVEHALSAHPSVRGCAVVPGEDKHGHRRLIAYLRVVDEDLLGAKQLRRFLVNRLPDYLVPSAFVRLDMLPLTPNGKIDYRALPAPDESALALNADYAPPRNELEQAIARIWKELLGIDRVGIHDNFFDLGGHSLLASQCASRVREMFNVEVPLIALFQEPTLINLADRVREAQLEERRVPTFPVMRVSREAD